jgi:hypothetical protein
MQLAMLMQWLRQTHLLQVPVRLPRLRLRNLLVSTTLQFKHCLHNWEQHQLNKLLGCLSFLTKRTAL